MIFDVLFLADLVAPVIKSATSAASPEGTWKLQSGQGTGRHQGIDDLEPDSKAMIKSAASAASPTAS